MAAWVGLPIILKSKSLAVGSEGGGMGGGAMGKEKQKGNLDFLQDFLHASKFVPPPPQSFPASLSIEMQAPETVT